MAAPQCRAGAIAPKGRLLFCMDLPLAMLIIVGVCANFSKYLESEGCQAAAEAIGDLARLPVFVPSDFPCGAPTLHQAAWFIRHPSAAFLLSVDPTHRCWMFVGGLLTPFIWLLSCILVSAASPTAYADCDIHLRSSLLPLMSFVPKAMALAQMAAHGPTPTMVHFYTPGIYTQLNLLLAFHLVLSTSIGSHLDPRAFLVVSFAELLLSLSNLYLLSMHGHATWTITYVATITIASLSTPLLFYACMLAWDRSSRRRRRLHGGGDGGIGAAGRDGMGHGATAAVTTAKVEGHALPPCSAGTSGEASGADPLRRQQQQALKATVTTVVSCSTNVLPCCATALQVHDEKQRIPAAIGGVGSSGHLYDGAATAARCGGGGGSAGGDGAAAIGINSRSHLCAATARGGGGDSSAGGNSTATLAGGSLLVAAAAAVAANNRARSGLGGGAVPFDDPEKWASVILVRQILAQPMAEYQPMFTRQRVSIKVSPCTCMDWIIYSFCLVVVEGVCSALTCLGGLTMPFFSTLSADPRV